MKGKWLRRSAICPLFALLLAALLTGAAEATQRWVVTSPVAPVFEDLKDVKAASNGRWEAYQPKEEENTFCIAYGDTLEAEPSKQEGWLSIKAGPDGTELLGFVEQKLLVPMPEHEGFAPRPWQVLKDGAMPYLLPGSLPLSDYSKFTLPRGAVVTALGQKQGEDGALWVLCTFYTNYDEGPDREALSALQEKAGSYGPAFSGSDSRQAWLRAEDLRDLSASSPDLTRVEEENLPASLEEEARAALLKNGFYLDPAPQFREFLQEDDLVDCYAEMNELTAKFITADLPMHAFHLYFDRSLQKLEEKALAPRVTGLLNAMRDAAAKLPKQLSASEPGRTAAANVKGFIALGLYLASNGKGDVPAEVREFAEGAMRGSGILEANPFTELPQDLSLFGPRGHYTLNDGLKAYFRASYLLGTAWPLDSENGAAATLILNHILSAPEVQKRWRAVADPISYLVGSSNVNSWDDLSAALKPFKLEDLAKPDRVKALVAALDAAGKKSVIQKLDGKKFAVLPRRVTFDAMVFDALTFPATSTREDMRPLPDPLDVMAVLGSPTAQAEVKPNGKFKDYEKNQRAMADLWEAYSTGKDGDNVYTDILKFVRAYLAEAGSKQFFANRPAWGYKKLITAEAAMTELKHDTILYAEQSGAEMGDGGGDLWIPGPFKLPIPRSYVEPVPALYSALAEAADRLVETLTKLLPKENEKWREYYAANLMSFAKDMRGLTAIAERALDDSMTWEDFEQLLSFRLASVLPEDIGEIVGEEAQRQLRMALVADVATSVPTGEVLFMGTGTPRKLRVYVNDKSGGFRVTEGYMFSYYTFTTPMGEKRMDDDEWKALVYDEKRQDELKMALPYWQNKVND
ncbi:hypothetical protein FF3_00146 [Fretibacterium fastidiosum]